MSVDQRDISLRIRRQISKEIVEEETGLKSALESSARVAAIVLSVLLTALTAPLAKEADAASHKAAEQVKEAEKSPVSGWILHASANGVPNDLLFRRLKELTERLDSPVPAEIRSELASATRDIRDVRGIFAEELREIRAQRAQDRTLLTQWNDQEIRMNERLQMVASSVQTIAQAATVPRIENVQNCQCSSRPSGPDQSGEGHQSGSQKGSQESQDSSAGSKEQPVAHRESPPPSANSGETSSADGPRTELFQPSFQTTVTINCKQTLVFLGKQHCDVRNLSLPLSPPQAPPAAPGQTSVSAEKK